MNFTDKLKLIRKTNEMTQAEFAESIGISRGNLANIERGIVKPTQIFCKSISRFQIQIPTLFDSLLSSSVLYLSLLPEK